MIIGSMSRCKIFFWLDTNRLMCLKNFERLLQRFCVRSSPKNWNHLKSYFWYDQTRTLRVTDPQRGCRDPGNTRQSIISHYWSEVSQLLITCSVAWGGELSPGVVSQLLYLSREKCVDDKDQRLRILAQVKLFFSSLEDDIRFKIAPRF